MYGYSVVMNWLDHLQVIRLQNVGRLQNEGFEFLSRCLIIFSWLVNMITQNKYIKTYYASKLYFCKYGSYEKCVVINILKMDHQKRSIYEHNFKTIRPIRMSFDTVMWLEISIKLIELYCQFLKSKIAARAQHFFC